MTLLYLLRHGAIDWADPECFIGQTDPPLSPEGRQQAHAWRNRFKNVDFTAVWSSDLKRATETAGIIFKDRTAEVRTCRELREIHLGEWDGQPRSRIRDGHPELWYARGKDLAGFRPPKGESFRDLRERVVPQVEFMTAAGTNGIVCAVSHAGVIRVLLCHFLQVPLSNIFRFRLDYGSLSIVSCRPGHIEVCALNLRPSNRNNYPGDEFGDQHDPAQI
jgi:alpha-ribazole phosphatase